ncbi:MAG: uncharacterized protein KVP18_001723 [Porospora cf. gigantea A]|uniref:uncharacterized protein n=1 Tax=Porospora cf. gigantea A TaxID=2853593 RepID=UPI00355A7E44|nr:MAG: hypothetical protein KVP18_001723 [Porospora cf. gigantea A]
METVVEEYVVKLCFPELAVTDLLINKTSDACDPPHLKITNLNSADCTVVMGNRFLFAGKDELSYGTSLYFAVDVKEQRAEFLHHGDRKITCSVATTPSQSQSRRLSNGEYVPDLSMSTVSLDP